MKESNIFVVYDIENDSVRGRVFEACKDYGLKTVQYSVFWGSLSPNRWEELFLRMKRELGDKEGYILLIPMCDGDFRKIQKTGEPLSPHQTPVICFV